MDTSENRQFSKEKTAWLFIKILAVIFICEVIVMWLFDMLRFEGAWNIILDPLLLAILITPLLYQIVVKPLRNAIEKRRQAQEHLGAANQQLQAQEQQLKASNQQLEANEQQLRNEINKRKKTAKELHESERKRQASLENSPVCTKIVDLDFNLQYMSRAGVEALKIDDAEQFYGKPYPLSFFPEPFRTTMTKKIKIVK